MIFFLKVWRRKYQLHKLLNGFSTPKKMIFSCVIEPHLLAINQGVSIFSINGQALLPFIESNKLTSDEYTLLVENHTPLLIYNFLMVKGFPEIKAANSLLDQLENKLLDNESNPWVIILKDAFYNQRAITKDNLVAISAHEATKLEIARSSYDCNCGKLIREFQALCLKQSNSKIISTWLTDKSKDIFDET